jgi:hypothetical protein
MILRRWLLYRSLVRRLRSDNEHVRRRAIYDIAGLGADAERLTPALVALLDDPRRDRERVLVTMALHQLGPIARAAAPRLLNNLRRERDVVWGHPAALGYRQVWMVDGHARSRGRLTQILGGTRKARLSCPLD